MVYQPDINQMRQSYTNVLAEQQKKALRGVQDIYGQRGTTGSGEEATAFGNLGQQFGLGAGQAEAGLQQYFGGLGMQGGQLAEQGRQFDVGQGNWGQQFGLNKAAQEFQQGLAGRQFGESQRQFDVGQGNWGRQFGESQRQFDVGQGNWAQQFGLNKALQEAGMTGMYGGQQTQQALQQQYANQLAQAGLTGQFQGQQTLQGQLMQQQLGQQAQEDATAQRLGFRNAYEMSLADPAFYQRLISQQWGQSPSGGTVGISPIQNNVQWDYAYGDNPGMEGNWGGGWQMTPDQQQAANAGFLDFGTHTQYKYRRPKAGVA